MNKKELEKALAEDLQAIKDKYAQIHDSAKKKDKPKVVKDYQHEVLAQSIYQVEPKKIKRKSVDLTPLQHQPILLLKGFSGWRLKKKLLRMPERFVMVRIFSLNRAVSEFYVPSNIDGFKYNKGRYIFDDTLKYWNATAKMWCYDYQEPITLPVHVSKQLPPQIMDIVEEYNENVQKGVKVDVDVDALKEIVEQTGGVDVENAINPKVLETYLKSNFVQSLVEGASLGKIFRIIVIMLVIILCVVVVVLILNAYSSGIFSELSNLAK